LGNERFRVQFTASQDLAEQISEAKALLRHSIPSGDLAEIVSRALALLIETEKKRQFGLTTRPRKCAASQPGKRRIPAQIRRVVYLRDEGRCTYVSEAGTYCEAREFLQFHHEDGWALHQRHDPHRITLRCQAHNQLAAESDFGREYMERRRGTPPGRS
jgi:hypothetical protein